MEGHEWLRVFIIRFGLYKLLVTPFGLQGALTTLQNYINDIFYDILYHYIIVYVDNIVIYLRNLKVHVK
jgi:hypothetical protein